MWTTNATFMECDGCNNGGTLFVPWTAKYSTERYGAFLQAAYKFGSESMQARQ